MHDLIAVVSLFLGTPLVIIGGIWCIVRARSVDIKWMLAMLLFFPLTLPAFCLFHWREARNPMLVTVAGLLLSSITFYYLAAK